jgi:hypothetical protein
MYVYHHSSLRWLLWVFVGIEFTHCSMQHAARLLAGGMRPLWLSLLFARCVAVCCDHLGPCI